MTRSPAVIIVARHGARLDAADKTWHLTSPAPYDPPLTYGGWTQARALGTRIASLLHTRDEEINGGTPTNGERGHNGLENFAFGEGESLKENRSQDPSQKKKHRKHKVVVHSSPFLRCVQTSIAISAGLAQFDPAAPSLRNRSHSHSTKLTSSHPLSPHMRPMEVRSPVLAGIPEPEDEPTSNVLRKSAIKKHFEKSILRVDAFLGEWLSPDYFDLITPPPESALMVATAKADLLRRGEYVDATPHVNRSHTGHFPGGWSRSNIPTYTPHGHGSPSPLEDLESLSHALPRRDRASSHSSVGSTGSRSSLKPQTHLSKGDGSRYIAPVPSYAVSPSEPIPRGYVDHARDACVDIDYNWDSMRPPQEWGDGGQYGEEWSSMHRRFRRGIDSMVDWYKNSPESFSDPTIAAVAENHTDELDDDTDLVLILVTHGAGCNALIGALTNQPVLLDVGMASLTMACRLDTPRRRESILHRTPSNQKSYLDSRLSEGYQMRLVASTEHLRPGVDPAKVVHHLPSPKVVPNAPENRRRYNYTPGSHAAAGAPINASFNLGEPALGHNHGISSMLGSIRRSSNSPIPTTSRIHTPTTSSTTAGLWTPSQSSTASGLWSPLPKPPSLATIFSEANKADASGGGPGRDMVLDFEGTNAPEKKVDAPKKAPPLRTQLWGSPGGVGGGTPAGLWASPTRIMSGDVNEREKGMKRRWTVGQGGDVEGEL
ncbi:hypothetical protein M501DRAFT_1030371 [Patellaria atrata CBS 101060]|uniref:Phosphoglycerate mutase-like protein n=1 Tax=Patellaria atrata CBS 101060 TaxID=1346257 RepID=A0A9P4SE21_9PEZI|nr:hypothetical protein M501DRAFT_1030371 [Patellaria atrata CBS 101060]